MSRKLALCVGCNYPSKAFGLAGAVNDAFLIADCLQTRYGFEPDNVLLLHDVYPGQKKSVKVDPAKQPTRRNILQGLTWLARNARPGDVVFFSFSGYGLQVDDVDNSYDEGYDEAILPTDFVDGREGDYSVIVTDDIHDLLTSVPASCTVTVLMDCDHASGILDVAGTLDGEVISGLKYQNFCGLNAHQSKMQLASHNRDVWQEEKARSVKARPRFQPMMEIDNPHDGKVPARPAMPRIAPIAFGYAAAGNGQTAMELQIAADSQEPPKTHGVLTWSFLRSVEELQFDCTHADLVAEIKRQMAIIKGRDLPKMDQQLQFTFSKPNSMPGSMKLFSGVDASESSRTSRDSDGKPKARPQVVAPKKIEQTGSVMTPHNAGKPPVDFESMGTGRKPSDLAPAAMPMSMQSVPSPGTGGIGSSGSGREREAMAGTGEAWPPLPAPPPPPPPRRVASEVVHHEISAPSHRDRNAYPEPPWATPSREHSRDPAYTPQRTAAAPLPPPPQLPNSQTQLQQQQRDPRGGDPMQWQRQAPPYDDQHEQPQGMPPRPPGHGGPFRHPAPNNAQLPFSSSSQQSLSSQLPTPPPSSGSEGTPSWTAPIKGLTPPNLFNAPSPLSFSHSFSQSFGNVQPGQRHPMHGPSITPTQSVFGGGGPLRR